ncbi:hypothetical protein CAAN1_04S02784 [[Candida] anglica]|uniref:ORC6 first cyclin-like domain-containing protein n=1 Tax=[Candida] anglica TaxID=148631 RepID=A0ABP0E8Z0_9ASCO
MSIQVKQSIKDIIPTQPDPLPAKLIAHTDSLYKLSLSKLPKIPNKAEIARYHICAYLSIEKLRVNLELPEPVQDKIPIQPKLLERVLDDFRVKVMGGSPSSTPKSSPTKNPMLSPTKASHNPKISSPLKRLQELRDEPQTPSKKLKMGSSPSGSKTTPFDMESPFNPKSIVDLAPPDSPSSSVPASPSRSKRVVQIPDLIAFANHFYIPATVTPQLLASFGRIQQKFAKKNEWLLACGMIHATYIRINHRLLEKRIGARSEFQDQLFQYQKGGLMKWNMLIWCNIVDDLVYKENWVRELERQYSSNTRKNLQTSETWEKEQNAKLGPERVLERFGAMIDSSMMFEKKSQQDYYDTWKSRVLEKISIE